LVTMDGAPTIPADLLLIEFSADTFDRRPRTGLTDGEPSATKIVDIANAWLARFRVLSRGSNVLPLRVDGTNWVIDYMSDDGEPRADRKGLQRRQMGIAYRFRLVGLDLGAWEDTWTLPADYAPPVWDVLLLDAQSLLPAVGPAIVLAYSALEVFISEALDR